MDVSYIYKCKQNFKEVVFYYGCNTLFRNMIQKDKQEKISVYRLLIDELQDVVLATEAIFFFLKIDATYPRFVGDEDKYIRLVISKRDPSFAYELMVKFISLCDYNPLEDSCREVLFEKFEEGIYEFKYINFISLVNCDSREDFIFLIDFTNKYGNYISFFFNELMKIKNINLIILVREIEKLIIKIQSEKLKELERLFEVFLLCFSFHEQGRIEIEIKNATELIDFILDLNRLLREDFFDSVIRMVSLKLRKRKSTAHIIKKLHFNYKMYVYHSKLNKVEETFFEDLGTFGVINNRLRILKKVKDSIPEDAY